MTDQTTEQQAFVRGRTASRLAAVQALYQLEMEPVEPQVVIHQFIERRFKEDGKIAYKNPDEILFSAIVKGVCQNLSDINQLIEGVLAEGWPLDRIELVLKAILRSGLFELRYHPDTPTAVIINEYVNLTKAFYSGQEPNFINASLDALAKQLRG